MRAEPRRAEGQVRKGLWSVSAQALRGATAWGTIKNTCRGQPAARDAPRIYSFTAPAVNPCTKYRCNPTNKAIGGKLKINEAANN